MKLRSYIKQKMHKLEPLIERNWKKNLSESQCHY